MISILERFPSVRRAYLARVGYQPDGQAAVAICIYSDHPNVAVARAIGDAFHALFAKESFVDACSLCPPNRTLMPREFAGRFIHELPIDPTRESKSRP